MNNIRPLMKRVCAYIIDLFIVLLVASFLAKIPLLNKNIDNYQKIYEEYEEEYNIFSEYLNLLNQSYEDELITEEEYNELIKEDKYSEIIVSKYDDKEISKGEYKTITKELNQKFDDIAKDYVYILNKEGIYNSIITLVCTLLYFGVIQYFLKGQTIGKKLLKLKVVSSSDKKINILNYLLRSLIVNDVFLNTIGLIFLVFASKNIYQQATNTLQVLVSIIEAIIIFLVLTREDGRGLHDLLCHTKVISTDGRQEVQDEEKHNNQSKVIDVDYKEESSNNGKETRKENKSRKK